MAHSDMRGANYAAEVQPKEVYRERRRKLMEAVGGGTIVVWGAGDERGYGDVGTFRQGSDFFYLTGVELPNAILVLRPDDGADWLFLPPRNANVERWTGPKWGPGEEAGEVFGFAEVLSTEPSEIVLDARRRPVPGFEGRLHGWLSEPGGMLWTDYPAVAGGSSLPPTHRFVASLRDRLPSFAVSDVSGQIHSMRVIKDGGEVALMRKAVAATVEGHRRASAAIRPGIGEGVVDGVVYAGFREAGAEGMAFPTIVGSGHNATTLHYDQNAGTCADGELVVVDIGARYGYYCGDLTRTYPVNGKFSARQREIYDLVLEAHDRVADAMRPGIAVFDLRKIAFGIFEESNVRDANGAALGQYFIHGLGHQLGLDAHDPGAADEVLLQPGMVITNEPGIYLPQESLGVRIENDFLITDGGAENLSTALPTTADDIEKMMGK